MGGSQKQMENYMAMLSEGGGGPPGSSQTMSTDSGLSSSGGGFDFATDFDAILNIGSGSDKLGGAPPGQSLGGSGPPAGQFGTGPGQFGAGPGQFGTGPGQFAGGTGPAPSGFFGGGGFGVPQGTDGNNFMYNQMSNYGQYAQMVGPAGISRSSYL